MKDFEMKIRVETDMRVRSYMFVLHTRIIISHSNIQVREMQERMSTQTKRMASKLIDRFSRKSVLKNMGLSEKEINEALDYKLSKGKYNLSNEDTLFNGMSAEEKFYLSFGNDSLFVDTTKYPKARIYGQDIFTCDLASL